MSQTCVACTRPVNNHRLCEHCTGTLARNLGDIPALVHELEITRTRQSRTGNGNGGRRGNERPLPWDQAAAEAQWVLDNTLTGWIRDLQPQHWPADTTEAKALWLLAHIDRLADHDAADELCDEIRDTVMRARTVIDLAAERIFVGPCGNDGCTVDLYAGYGAEHVTCRECHTRHPIAQRRAELLDRLDDQLAYAAQLARALTNLDEPVTEAAIRDWARHKRILVHGTDHHGRPLYRVGEVREVAARVADARARRAERARA